jgi:hypothetical protein
MVAVWNFGEGSFPKQALKARAMDAFAIKTQILYNSCQGTQWFDIVCG